MLCRRLCPRREPLIVCYLCLSPVKVKRVLVCLLYLFVCLDLPTSWTSYCMLPLPITSQGDESIHWFVQLCLLVCCICLSFCLRTPEPLVIFHRYLHPPKWGFAEKLWLWVFVWLILVFVCVLLVFVCVFVFDLDFQFVTVPPFLSSPHGLTALTGVFFQKICVKTKIRKWSKFKTTPLSQNLEVKYSSDCGDINYSSMQQSRI